MQKSGIILEAQGASQYFRDLARADAANTQFGQSASTAAKSASDFGRAADQINLQKLNNQLENQRTRLGILAQELAQTSQKYGESSVQAQKKQAALDALAGQMSITMDKALLLEKAITQEARAATESSDATAKLGDTANDAAQDFANAGRSIDAFGQMVVGGLRRVGEMAINSFADASRAALDFVKGSVTAAGDYEASLNRFTSVTSGAMREAGLSLSDFSNLFLDLGAKTQYSAAQASDAANELAKGGVPIKDIFGEATEATLNLASAAELDLAPAATILAKQLGVWGDKAGGAKRVTDLLAQAANASTVDVDDLALGLANVGGVAKGAGLSFEETVRTIGLLAPGFSSASDAGTSLKTFLNQLVPTTTAAKNAMRDLGLYSDETGSAFYDAQGNFVGMEQATRMLHDATVNLTTEQRSLALETIFGSDAQRAALMLAEQGADGYTAFGDAMIQAGTATEQAAQKNQGFNFAMESLSGSVETLQIKLGQKLLPILTNVINNGLIPIVNWAADHVVPAIDTVGEGFSRLGRGMTVVVDFVEGNAVPVLATLTAGLGTLAVAGITPTIVGLGGLSGTFVMAAASAKAFALSAATAAAPLALLAGSLFLVYKAGQQFQTVNKQLAEGTQAILGQKQWWNDATEAIEMFNQKQGQLGTGSRQLAEQLNSSTMALESMIQQRAKWDALGLTAVGPSQAEIQAQADAIKEQTKALNDSMAATQQANAQWTESAQRANVNARELDAYTSATTTATSGTEQLTGAVHLSAEAQAEYETALQSARQGGLQSLSEMEGAYVNHYAAMGALRYQYNQATSDAERAAIQQSMNDLIIANAEKERVTRESLGRQLIDLTIAEAQKNGVSQTALAQMTQALQQEYGVQSSVSEQVYGLMSGDIAHWAETGGQSSDELMAKLRDTGDTAFATHQTVSEMQGSYTVWLEENFKEGKLDADTFYALMREAPTNQTLTLFQNFMDGKISAQEFLNAVNAIPARKDVNVHTTYSHSGDPPPEKGGAEARAEGGGVRKGQPYKIGERGWELLLGNNGSLAAIGVGGMGYMVAPYDGRVIPHRDSVAMLARGVPQPVTPAFAQPLSGRGFQPPASPTQIYNTSMLRTMNSNISTTNNFNLGVTTNQSTNTVRQSFAQMQAILGG